MICLITSPIKQIRYTVENTIIIKHSLTVTKFPKYSQNPLTTHDVNVISNRKEFYAFAIFRDVLAPNILTLNIKSVNLYVNILTTSSDRFKTFQKMWLLEKHLAFNYGFQLQVVLLAVQVMQLTLVIYQSMITLLFIWKI